MKKDTSYPAFPSVMDAENVNNPVGKNINLPGMDLRDYFAARAMQGILNRENHGWSDSDSHQAYHIADSMMKQREL